MNEVNLTVRTSQGHTYYLSESWMQLFLLHPLLAFVKEAIEVRKVEEETLLREAEDSFSYEGVVYKKEEIDYYIRKYRFLKAAGIFDTFPRAELVKENISMGDVEYALRYLKQVDIELTQFCNLKCKYCFYGELYKQTETRNHRIRLENLWGVFDRLFEYWGKKWLRHPVHINYYGGEPLLEFEAIRRITTYLKERENEQIRFEFGLTTNAVLLTEEMIRFFIRHQFKIAVSLDGDRKQNAYRVTAANEETYDKVVASLELIRSIDPVYFEKKIHLIAVLHSRNSLTETIDFLKKQYGKTPTMGELNAVNLNEGKQEEYARVYRPARQEAKEVLVLPHHTLNLADELRQFLPAFNGSQILQKEGDDLFFLLRRVPTGTCYPFEKKLFITADYLALPCERIGFSNHFGTLPPGRNIRLIDPEQVARQHNSRLKRLVGRCKQCYYNWLCRQCMYTLLPDVPFLKEDVPSEPPPAENGSPEGLHTHPTPAGCPSFFSRKEMEAYLGGLLNYVENNPRVLSEF